MAKVAKEEEGVFVFEQHDGSQPPESHRRSSLQLVVGIGALAARLQRS